MIHPKYDWLIDPSWDDEYDENWPLVPKEENIVLRLLIEGQPVPKMRARMTKRGHVYTPTKTLNAERLIASQAIKAIGVNPNDSDAFGMHLRFFTSNFFRRDIDNLTKLVFDAFNNVVWKDDTQVVELVASLDRFSQLHARTEIVCYVLPGIPISRILICETCGNEIRKSRGNLSKNATGKFQYCSKPCANIGKSKLMKLRHQQLTQLVKILKL